MGNIYSFIILKNYPRERRYIIRKRLNESIFDRIKNLFRG